MTGPRTAALAGYLLISRLAGPLAPWLLRRRQRRGKEDAARLGERLGRPGLPRPDGPLIWMHGASVGEAMSMLPLIHALDTRVLVTTGTVTSARRMAEVLPPGALHQFVPVDTAAAVGPFLDHWRPDLALWIESEIWPRLVTETHARDIPMALVNARLSEKSARGWARVPAMARDLFGCFRLILAQDRETVARLGRLGAEADFAGNLKALVPAPEADEAALAALRQELGDRPVWLAASTHPGEEEAVLAAHRIATGTRLILAPRHPERGEDLARLIRDNGHTVYRRSEGGLPDETDILLADTLGEMGLWYRLAPVTFVGGSLEAHGGHTPFEPIALGSAVLHGPHVANFAPSYRALDAAGGARAVTAETLGQTVADLLADPAARAPITDAAERVHGELCPDPDALAARLTALMATR